MTSSVCEQCLDEHPETEVSPCEYEECSIDVCDDCSETCEGVCQPSPSGCGYGDIQKRFCSEHFQSTTCCDASLCPECYWGMCEIDYEHICICPDCSVTCSNCRMMVCEEDCSTDCYRCELIFCVNCGNDCKYCRDWFCKNCSKHECIGFIRKIVISVNRIIGKTNEEP